MNNSYENGQSPLVVINGKLCTPTSSTSPGSDIGPTTTVEDIRCQECDITFEKWLDLLQHTTAVHPQLDDQELDDVEEGGESGADDSTNDPDRKLRTTWCHICKKHLATVSSRNLHMRIHTGERPFVCTECGKAFTQNVHLRSHMSVHTGAKPYSCKVCNKGFVAGRTLKIHMMSHTREQPHTCQWCARKFLVHQHLVTHMATHHAELMHQHQSPPAADDVDDDNNSPLTMVVAGAAAPSSTQSTDSSAATTDQSFQEDPSTPCLNFLHKVRRQRGVKRTRTSHTNRNHNGHRYSSSASCLVDTSQQCRLDFNNTTEAMMLEDDDVLLADIGNPSNSNESATRKNEEKWAKNSQAADADDQCLNLTTTTTTDIWQKAVKMELPFDKKPAEEEKPRPPPPLTTKSSSRRKSQAVSRSSVLKNASTRSVSTNQTKDDDPSSGPSPLSSIPVTVAVVTDSLAVVATTVVVTPSTNLITISSSSNSLGTVNCGSSSSNRMNNHHNAVTNCVVTSPLTNQILPPQQQTQSQPIRMQNGFNYSSVVNHNTQNTNHNHSRMVIVDSNSSSNYNVVGTSVQQCPNCLVVEGELQLLKTEMAMIKQFLANKLTLMEQKIDNMHALIKQ